MEIGLMSEFIMDLQVQCSEAYKIGTTNRGFLSVIPIVGGVFSGLLSGVVIPGGADWSYKINNTKFCVSARYMIKTDDNEYIGIENSGILDTEEKNKMIVTHPVFSADMNGKYQWLNHGVFVGSLEAGSEKNSVHIRIYKMH